MSINLSKKRTFLQSPVVIALILCFTFGYFINDVTLVLIDGSNADICIEYYPKHFPCSGMEKYNCARDFVNEALNKNHIQFGDINIIPILGLYWQFWYIDYWYLFWGVFVFLLIIIVLWVIYIVISKRRT